MSLISQIDAALRRGLGVAGEGAQSSASETNDPPFEQTRPGAVYSQRSRMRLVCDRELEALRIALRLRKATSADGWSGERSTLPGKPNSAPAALGKAEMVSRINEIEAKIMSSPMKLFPRPRPRPMPTPAPQVQLLDPMIAAFPPTQAVSDPLDEAAAMFAARRVDLTVEHLLAAIRAGPLASYTSWALRCVIDLLERSGSAEPTQTLRQEYEGRFAHAPTPVLPPITGPAAMPWLSFADTAHWLCPMVLDEQAAIDLMDALNMHAGHGVLVIDWTAIDRLSPMAQTRLQAVLDQAIGLPMTFFQVGLPRLARLLRADLQMRPQSRESWTLWLTLLNWNGFNNSYQTALPGFIERCGPDPRPYAAPVCASVQLAGSETSGSPVSALQIRLAGVLTRDHAESISALDVLPSRPGQLVLVDCRSLECVDFFFGAEIVNWSMKRSASQETVCFAHVHPLLAHFLRMLGLHDHAKLIPAP